MMWALTKIRLSYLFVILLLLYFLLLLNLPRLTLTSGQLGLFGVTGFLFGYYFAPIYNSQKARVDKMADTVRQESLTVYAILRQSHLLDEADRRELKQLLRQYIANLIDNRRVQAENDDYDKLLVYASDPKFKEVSAMSGSGGIYSLLTDTQGHRDQLSVLYRAKVYSNEWITGLTLFAFTLFFAVEINYGHNWFFNAMAAALCTSLTMLVFILLKYSTLTHKAAREIWEPLRTIRRNNFKDLA